jgi:hypothetical protein
VWEDLRVSNVGFVGQVLCPQKAVSFPNYSLVRKSEDGKLRDGGGPTGFEFRWTFLFRSPMECWRMQACKSLPLVSQKEKKKLFQTNVL